MSTSSVLSALNRLSMISARAPDGNCLPAVPIYTKRTPEAERAEEAALRPVARIFAEKMAEYIKEAGKIEPGLRL